MKKPSISSQPSLFDLEPISAKPKQKSEANYIFDITDALSAPILTFSQSWADLIPKRVLNAIPMARMLSLMKNESTATYAECAVYIYTRTHEAPMDSDWTNIYTHVSCKTLEDWFGEDHWDAVGAPRELNDWLRSKLKGLQNHIYDKRRELLKSELKSREAESKPTIEVVKKRQATNQRTLFG